MIIKKKRHGTPPIAYELNAYISGLYYDSVGDHVLLDLYLSQENSSSGWVAAGGG